MQGIITYTHGSVIIWFLKEELSRPMYSPFCSCLHAEALAGGCHGYLILLYSLRVEAHVHQLGNNSVASSSHDRLRNTTLNTAHQILRSACNSAYSEIPRWPPFYVNSNCLIWHDPYVHRINKSLVRMEPFQFVLEELQKDSEASMPTTTY